MIKSIRERQPELDITDIDVLCIALAGLCHDVGHPCYSHTFETFMKKKSMAIEDPALRKAYQAFNHEVASLMLIDQLIIILKAEFTAVGLTDLDFTFIKELIEPPKSQMENAFNKGVLRSEWSNLIKGRPVKKAWMFEIVSNWRNGVDTDKMDYFRRDAQHFGIRKFFDHDRYFARVRVMRDNLKDKARANWTIAVPDKERSIMREDFVGLRKSLHRMAYQHKTVKKLEEHMADILVMMDPHIFFPGKDGVMKTMSQTAMEL